MVNNWTRLLATPGRLLPSDCLLCAGPAGAGQALCRNCRKELPLTRFACPTCALPLPQAGASCGSCLADPPLWRRCVAPLLYRPPASQLVAAFKYRGQLAGGRLLTRLLIEALQRHPIDIDLIVPVPLHWRRRWQRRFNQAELIADQLSTTLRIPASMKALRRRRPTPAQQSLDAKARARNLRGAFALHRSVAGLRVALVDDVVTTGATATELCRLLRKGGATAVELWALARTPLQ